MKNVFICVTYDLIETVFVNFLINTKKMWDCCFMSLFSNAFKFKSWSNQMVLNQCKHQKSLLVLKHKIVKVFPKITLNQSKYSNSRIFIKVKDWMKNLNFFQGFPKALFHILSELEINNKNNKGIRLVTND